MPCNCEIPNKANWYVHIVFTNETETTYTDIYVCDEHMPDPNTFGPHTAREMLKWDGHEKLAILEIVIKHLRDDECQHEWSRKTGGWRCTKCPLER